MMNMYNGLTYAEMTDEQRSYVTNSINRTIHELLPEDMSFVVVLFGVETGLVCVSSNMKPNTCKSCKCILENIFDVAKESVSEMKPDGECG